MDKTFDSILKQNRGYVSKWPTDAAVMIVSGGLDSIITSARLIEERGLTLYPLHIERGQTNYEAERRSIEKYEKLFRNRYVGKFKPVSYIKLNIPPLEIKDDLLEYTKENGHPLRDTVLQMAAVQYAISLRSKGVILDTVFCAVMPEDYFPHSKIESIRATNIAVCQNLNDWGWLITSPNVDHFLTNKPISKSDEIQWANNHNISSYMTVSCNVATKKTNYLNCGKCSSCDRRREAYKNAGVPDKTQYYEI